MAASTLSFNGVRSDGLPVYSLDRQQKMEELRLLLRFDHRRLIRGGVVGQTMHAMGLAGSYFPHMWGIRCGDMLTPQEVYSSEASIARVLLACLMSSPTPSCCCSTERVNEFETGSVRV